MMIDVSSIGTWVDWLDLAIQKIHGGRDLQYGSGRWRDGMKAKVAEIILQKT